MPSVLIESDKELLGRRGEASLMLVLPEFAMFVWDASPLALLIPMQAE